MRCIRLHHILGYQGLGQKIGYVFRRLMGMDTPSADLVGCSHQAVPSWDWSNPDYKYILQAIITTQKMYRLPAGSVLKMNVRRMSADNGWILRKNIYEER